MGWICRERPCIITFVTRPLILLLCSLGALLADDHIILRTGENITANDYLIGPLYATVGKRSIPRSSLESIERGRPSAPPTPATSTDTLVLTTGDRLTGHVIYASPTEIQLDRKRIPAKDIAEIIFATGQPGDWAVEVSNSGGFTGRGGPHVVATSYGYGSVAEINLPRGEDAVIPPDILHSIDAVVRAAKPSEWKPSYVPAGDNGCCDRFQETFSLQVAAPGGKWIVYHTIWFSGNQDLIPADLKAVIAVVMTNRKNFTKQP